MKKRGLDLLVEALATEKRTGDDEKVRWVCNNVLPNGSGFDTTPFVEHYNLNGEWGHTTRIVIVGGFHPMNDVGMYKGWVQFSVTIKPSFFPPDYFTIRVTLYGASPSDRDALRDYIEDCYYDALSAEHEEMEV